MIHVERTEAPPELLKAAEVELERAHEFYSQPESERGQRRFDFGIYRIPSVRSALAELFHGKCAYCESRFTRVLSADLEHYRPKSAVAERPEHPGYWWLAMKWDNLLYSCQICNQRGKRNRFPIFDENYRAFGPTDPLDLEYPLLLDPCVDYPEEHLVFSQDGTVAARTERGNMTISVIGLNREALVESRRQAAKELERQIRSELRSIYPGPEMPGSESISRAEQLQKLSSTIGDLIRDDQEYAGMKRQVIPAILSQAQIEFPGLTENVVAQLIPDQGIKISKADRQAAQESFQAFQREQESFSLAEEKGRVKARQQRQVIEWVKLQNVKAIRDLCLDMTASEGDKTPWLLLLGENGTGKSTVLHAIALTLVGAQYFTQLVSERGLQPSKYRRYRSRKESTVQVKLSGFREPHKLMFRPTGVEFTSPLGKVATVTVKGGSASIEGEGWEPQFILLAYGSTRLLPRRTSEYGGGEWARVDNLFDPFTPLIDAEQYLLQLDETMFNRAALVLKDLLALDQDAYLKPEAGTIKLITADSRVPLSDLSDGYQSIIAMTVDIIQAVSRLWPRLENAEGIVLLDEVGAHLHPRWKMRVVASLRRAFPGVQFIATTHQPLCLRGLAKGETVVMRRDRQGQIIQITDLPDPGEYRVDQLLTSRFFGLLSTYDPELEDLYDEYYHLKVLGESRLDDEQRARFDQLRKKLSDRKLLGATPREELMYTVIDELLAREHVKDTPSDVKDLEEEAVARVSDLWKQHLDF